MDVSSIKPKNPSLRRFTCLAAMIGALSLPVAGHASMMHDHEQFTTFLLTPATEAVETRILIAGTLQDIVRRQVRTRLETGEFGESELDDLDEDLEELLNEEAEDEEESEEEEEEEEEEEDAEEEPEEEEDEEPEEEEVEEPEEEEEPEGKEFESES